MKTKQILAIILAVILGASIVPLDAKAGAPEAYASNVNQEIEADTDRGLLDDADAMYSITEKTVHVQEWEKASFTLEQDSYVEFDCRGGGHDAWSLDEIKQGGMGGLIYEMDLPKRFLLKKGHHYMYLASASSSALSYSAYLTYKIYPICGIYYLSGDEYKKITSYTLQSYSQTMAVPEKSFRGYTFGGWYEDEGLTIPFTSVDMSIGNDWYVYPKLTPIVYTITYEMNGGINNPENPDGYIIEDKKITLQPPTKEGYKFSRWYVLSGGKKVTITEIDASKLKNIKVFAEWSEQEYSITYENVDKHKNPSIYKASNGTVTLSSPSKREGYDFAGWYLDADSTQPITEIDCSMKKNITIYAKWEPIFYKIIYELNGGTENTENPDGYTIEDEKIALQPPIKDGAEFEGWFTDSAFKKKITEINPTNCTDIKLYAKWKKSSSGANVTPGLRPSVTPTPKPSATPTLTPSVTPTVSGDQNTKYKIIYKNMNGATNPNPASYIEGDAVIRLKDPSKPMHTFSGWYTTVGFNEGSKVDSVDTSFCRDIILYARWTENTYAEEVYKIEKKSDRLGSRGNAIFPNELAMEFPRDGKVYFSNELPEKCRSASFTLDEEFSTGSHGGVLPTKNISELSRILSAGSHHLYCYSIGSSAAASSQDEYTTVSYTYHPQIYIYYVIEGHPYKYADYYMEDSPTQTKLPMPEVEGYEVEGLYCDAEHTIPMEYYDQSIGQDLYIYPKIKSDGSITDPSEEEYKIITDSKALGFNERFYLGPFPTDGKIIFKDVIANDSAYSSYSLDYYGNIIAGADRYEECAANFSGNISKGNHLLRLERIMPVTWTNTVSYTFYPKCRVYCVYEGKTEEVASYYLEESYSKLTLKAPSVKGYRVLGLYADRSLTIPVNSVSKGIGKDWYVYPKVEPVVYSITYDLDGGTNHKENKETYSIEDKDIVLRTPTKAGYTFEGWYSTPALKTKVAKIKTDGCKNIKVYAKWKKGSNANNMPSGKPKRAQELKVFPDMLVLYVGGISKSIRIYNAKGKVTYKSSNASVAKVNGKGSISPMSEGNATITIQAAGNSSYKEDVKKIKVIVFGKPAKVKNVKVTSAGKKRTVDISWGRSYPASGYIVRYSYKKSMAGGRVVKITGQDSCNKILKSLKSKKYVYVQVQAYIKDGNILVKGPWSKVTRSKGKIR